MIEVIHDVLAHQLTSQKILNIIGLVCDIAGVCFVAKSFKNIRREKTPPTLWSPEGDKKKKAEEEHNSLMKFDRIGMYFLIIGFIFQLLSNLL